jgi:glycosyltransferase involved in cell wall biosynthesis
MVDAFHFNSQNTADVYGKYLDIPSASKVIPITHSGIHDRRKARSYDDRLLRLAFIGSESPYKGLPILKKVIAQLNKEGYTDKITLYVYGGRTGDDEELAHRHVRNARKLLEEKYNWHAIAKAMLNSFYSI